MKHIKIFEDFAIQNFDYNHVNENLDPKMPANLGFDIKDGPVGKVVTWKDNQPDNSNPIASTNLIIKPGAKIKVVKKGQIQVEAFLYFRKDSGKAGDTSIKGKGTESSKAVRGTSIPKTAWYDCSTNSFYVWYDSNKVVFQKDQIQRIADTGPFFKTMEYIGNKVCGLATQAELIDAFKK